MPYLGGATLSRMLAELRRRSPKGRPGRGRDLLQALDRVAEPEESESSERGAARQVLLRLNYAQSVAWIIARLAEALDTAHRRGVLHGDLKPSNVLLAADGRPMLLDFNLAIEWERDPAADAGGTLAYMAPERLRALAGRASQTPDVARVPIVGPLARRRADLYALGLILHESICLEPPKLPCRETATESLIARALDLAIQRSHPDWVRRQIADSRIPVDLRPVLRRCLAPDAMDRYTRAGELAEDLDRFVTNRAPVFAKSPSSRARTARWLRRHRIAATLIGLVSAVGGLAIGLARLHLENNQQRSAIEKLEGLWGGGQPGVFRLHRIGSDEKADLAVHGRFAQRHLDVYGVLDDLGWRERDDVRVLPRSERIDLELWLFEQAWRYARALAQRPDSPNDWRRALIVLDHDPVWSQVPVVVALREHIDSQLDRPIVRTAKGTLPIEPALLAYSEGLAIEETDRNRARAWYERVLSIHPKSFWASYRAAVQAHREGYNILAYDYLTNCLKVVPGNPILHIQLAGCLFRLDKNVEAQWHLDQAVLLAPDLGDAYHARFFVRPRLGQAQGFDADLKRYSLLAGHSQSASSAHLWSTGSESNRRFLDDEERTQWATESWLLRAMALERARRFDEAIALLDKILEVDARHLMARYTRGVVLLRQKKRSEAVDEFRDVVADPRFEKTVREDPRLLELHGFGVRECLRKNRHADAVAFAQSGLLTARRLNSPLDVAKTQYWLATALAFDARPEGEAFERIVELLSESRAGNPALFDKYFPKDQFFDRLRKALEPRLTNAGPRP
jgi:tetratricopeptide (TPR) repeat protein